MAESSSNNKDTNRAPESTAGANTRQFGLRQFYLKDLSFEAPNSPGIFSESGLEPEIKVRMHTSNRDLGNGVAEVVLHLSVHSLAGQRTVFLVDLEQAGTFQISGFPPDETRAIIGVACPNALFPYAREAVSSVLQRGGFAQVLLQHVDFSALFAKDQASRATSAATAGPA